MKINFLVVIALASQINFGQNTVPTSGAVSLDTNLKIGNQIAVADGEVVRLSLVPYRHTGGPWNFKSRDNANIAFLDIDYGVTGSALTITSDKNVGIGINTPFSKLSVAGSLTINGGLSNTLSRPAVSQGTLVNGEVRGYSNGGNAYDDGFLRLSAGGGTNGFVKSYIDLSGYSTIPDMDRNIVLGTSGVERMRIDINGNIGIGTKAPDAKLAVNGTIHSKEVKVDVNFPAPDYVFANDYKLRSLQEVEKFVNQNSHLPEIPSAKEFEKNGIQLAEMNMALLKKIEELTLYAIEQQKNTDKLTKVIEEQNKRLEVLESK